MTSAEALWLNARLATMRADSDYGAIEDGAIAVSGDRILWIGARADLPPALRTASTREHDAGGRWITPGLIDCHTHLVYAGSRAGEFEQRLNGATYEEIARAGGGIRATVAATRAASEAALVEASKPRLKALAAEGVTTVEIKSGYGLETGAETKMLRVARALGNALPVTVRTTFLGAHALPPEADGDKDGYIARLCGQMLPAIAEEKLADAVDAFMEGIAFSGAQTARVFEVAKRLGLPVKLHADQLSNLGGANLAARYGALSADHLEYTDAEGIAALKAAGIQPVLLPGSVYALGSTRYPAARGMIDAGLAVVLATDFNPGSAFCESLPVVMSLACTQLGLAPAEALSACTVNAAHVLGRADRIGRIEVGYAADLVLLDVPDWRYLAYHLAGEHVASVVKEGEVVWER